MQSNLHQLHRTLLFQQQTTSHIRQLRGKFQQLHQVSLFQQRTASLTRQQRLNQRCRQFATHNETHEPHHWYSNIILLRQKPFLQRVGFFVRLIRIPVIAAGIYSLGYQNGIIESQRNPQHFQAQLLDAVLKESFPEGTVDVVETIS